MNLTDMLFEKVRTDIHLTDSLFNMKATGGGGTITDLTGTKWYFNETIDLDGFISVADSSMAIYLNFKDNDGDSNTVMGVADGCLYYGHYRAYNPTATGSKWVGSEYGRTITISGGTDATNAGFIAWIVANATQLEV